MTKEELLYLNTEEFAEYQTLELMNMAISELKQYAKDKDLPFIEYEEPIDEFLHNYALLSKIDPIYVRNLLGNYDFSEKSAIHELLYLFLKDQDIKDMIGNNLIRKINLRDGKYTIDTSEGIIKLASAKEFFEKTEASWVFQQELSGQCYKRTTEFVQQMPDYELIVTHLPNIFGSTTFNLGHYHAYAKNKEIIVDPAINGIFFDNTGEIVERGKIVLRLTSEELAGYSDDDVLMQSLRNMAKISVTEVTELTNQHQESNKKVFTKSKSKSINSNQK